MKFTLATAAVAVLAVAGSVEANKAYVPTTPAGPATPSKGGYVQGNVPEVIKYALQQLNDIRASKGLQPLCINPQLQASAQDQSNWMAKTGDMDHRPDTFDRFSQYGYAQNVARAENIAVNMPGVSKGNCFGKASQSVSDLMTSAGYTTACAWYNSPGHYANMMTPEFNQVGIAYTQGKWSGRDSYYWTQDFGRSNLPCVSDKYQPAPAPAPKPAPAPAPKPVYKPAPAPKPVPAPAPKPYEGNKGEETKPVAPKPYKEAKPADVPAPAAYTKKPVPVPTYADAKPADYEADKPTKTTPAAGYDAAYPTAPVAPKAKKCKKWVKGGKKSSAAAYPTQSAGYDAAPKDVTAPYGTETAVPTGTTPSGDYGYGKDAAKPTGAYPAYPGTETAVPTGTTPSGDYGYGKDAANPTGAYPAYPGTETAVPTGTTPAGGYSYGDAPVPAPAYGKKAAEAAAPAASPAYAGNSYY
ncbi:CAP domain-containing protein [Blastocladiella britannica]|nr:CAP domain-containing protein [Blastocladiella britannica]